MSRFTKQYHVEQEQKLRAMAIFFALLIGILFDDFVQIFINELYQELIIAIVFLTCFYFSIRTAYKRGLNQGYWRQ